MGTFDVVQHLLTTFFFVLTAIVWGVALIPAVYGMIFLWMESADWGPIVRSIALGLGAGLSYITWVCLLLFEVGFIGAILRPRLPEGRIPLRSFTTVRWGMLGALHRMAINQLGLVVPSYMGSFYYRLMGCKVGKGAQLNSTSINDCFMVHIGDRTVIGGGAAINGHIVEKGELVLSPVRIGKDCVIGSGSFINPGCTIGDGAVLASRAVLPKWTEIPPGEVWAGIPARRIQSRNTPEED
ncbi:MAG TPA: hypothetical protein HA330_03670 [Candidatus Thalassarchaeaceae archaeon]|nr:MAG TPA: hypothetical protein D7H85_03670 [Candidatus Poseidoniales archaeon]HII48967.1 hypothetical protein [Candidatus Thalassarchaeaceae archaeon]